MREIVLFVAQLVILLGFAAMGVVLLVSLLAFLGAAWDAFRERP